MGCMDTNLLNSLKESAKLDKDRRKCEQIIMTMKSVDPELSFLDEVVELQQWRDALWDFDDKSERIKKYQCVFR